MWITSTEGFFSVVEHRDDDKLVLIRARARKDLENLVAVGERAKGVVTGITDESIIEDNHADYRWRIITTRNIWHSLLDQLVDEIDYDNFKNAVGKKDKRRTHFLMKVWSAMFGVQTEEKYGREDAYRTPPAWRNPEDDAWVTRTCDECEESDLYEEGAETDCLHCGEPISELVEAKAKADDKAGKTDTEAQVAAKHAEEGGQKDA